jgi:beta-aspartyl-peptidase (threonine type)
VGDSALIGCGTYADELGGVSCTGNGEAIIRTVLAKTAITLLHNGLAPNLAVSRSLARLDTTLHSAAGLIMINHKGRIAYARHTPHMPICAITGQGDVQTAI